MGDFLTIGEFAKRSWLSPKALRLYESKGVLAPSSVDTATGYRRYSVDQLITARLIVLLRRIEMPLSEILLVVKAAPKLRAQQIAEFLARREEDFARQRSLAEFLIRAVVQHQLDGYGVAAPTATRVSMREVPSRSVMTRRMAVTAGDLPAFLASAIDGLVKQADSAGGLVGPPFVIYHGEVSWESDGPVEVCLPIRDTERAHRVDEGHCEVFVQVPKSEVQFPRILEAFEAVRTWSQDHGLTPLGPPREVYFADFASARPDDVVCDVALPVVDGTGGSGSEI